MTFNKWLPIKPVPRALIVNIGDMFEIMSNGENKSIEHTAMVNSEKERLSIAAFHGIKLEGTVGPLPHLTKRKRARY
ncbi:hypothetical protein MLD38_037712 [Melastoma candidum]|uniref:Uncharacterized protein n=1 Tax=Melastoma candidum TaxID=119954 RepID=A0ACB9LN39_9MYRT|nr:hypothetical protein MLD38_037712 [Melastoma candidum]